MRNGDVESICFGVCDQCKNSGSRKDATEQDLMATKNWQTAWTTPYAKQLPNKVALHRMDNDELLGLMSYELDEDGLAVEILYLENARHSNANLLHLEGGSKSTSALQKHCLLMQYRFHWTRDLMAF